MVEIVVITGHLGVGKSDLADRLEADDGYFLVRSSDEVRKRFDPLSTNRLNRKELQASGTKWDKENNGRWLYEIVAKAAIKHEKIVVDHVRNKKQLKHFRKQPDWQTTHVHLYAPQQHRERQHGSKLAEEKLDYDQANSIQSEKDIEEFKRDADVRINVNRSDANDTYIRVAARLRLFSEPNEKLVDVLIGGQFGSEGKGHISAALARDYDLVIRVGGPNAGHTVSSASGRYTYHQLPSGAKDFRAKILLGPGMTIYKKDLLKEIIDCGLTSDRLCIDPQAMLISEEDREAENTMRNEIASTGSGSGAASARRIMERKADPPKLAGDDPELRKYTEARPEFTGDAVSELERQYKKGSRILLEGTQGSGLSIFHGEYPHVTSRDTNVAGCLAEAGVSPRRVRRVIMVVRTTPIRVANPDGGVHTSGSMKHETDFKTISREAGLPAKKVMAAEKTSTTRRDRRVGWFDWELFRRACILNNPTDIALTFTDYISAENRRARRFEQLTENTIKFIEEIEHVAQAPVSVISTRFPDVEKDPDIRALIDRRSWR